MPRTDLGAQRGRPPSVSQLPSCSGVGGVGQIEGAVRTQNGGPEQEGSGGGTRVTDLASLSPRRTLPNFGDYGGVGSRGGRKRPPPPTTPLRASCGEGPKG